VTWEVASFLIVGAVIVAGFAWYERSRPPAQVVALVAALAALAIAGRIAFAAFPNVKPTTDIVIFAGYALGGAPGFAVGALAALVSNFWFGQGPWTPWQMAGWGLCGILGALLALGIRNAGRFALAATCGFAGILYGALLNFSLMATYGGDLSLRHFLVLEARAIPFEIAHVAGNVVLALLAGPAMVRMLTRFRERFEWRRGGRAPALPGARGRLGGALRGGGIAALLVLALAALLPSPARAEDPITRAANWLQAQQRPSGGFPATPGQEAGAEMTSWAMLALAATGRNPLDIASGGKTPVDYLRSHIDEISDAGDEARTILALAAAGVDPRSFAGRNLIDGLVSRRAQNGSYQGWPGTSTYAVLALRAAGANDATAPTVAWLRSVQGKDGGWGNEPKSPSTAEITGAVLQVLTPGSEAANRALGYLRKAKRQNGGFAPGGNLGANAQATAWTAAGLLAAGEDPATFGKGRSSYSYLLDLQTDAGYFLKEPNLEATPIWVTADVLIPLTSHHLPIVAPPRAPKPKKAAKKAAPTPKTGGASPPLRGVPPSSLAEALPPALKDTFEGKAGKALQGDSAPSGKKGGGAGAVTEIPPTAGSTPEEDLGNLGSVLPGDSAPQATGEPTSETTGDSGSSTAGAVLLGLLAGCVLFGAGLAGRAGWMRWRYGL
jgi:energy-coupling factor transport system substrate-specific component